MPDTDTASTPPVPSFADYSAEVHQAADKEQAQAQEVVGAAEASGQQQIDLAKEFASTQQPFTQTPPTDQINQVMSGAPWLFALTALGGKLSGANGLAMLQGLNGMSDGIIKGDQESLHNAYQNYQASFDKWKANTDQQYRVYKELSDAYAGANDGKLRALTASLNITGDATKMKLAVDDPTKYWEVKAKLEESHAKVLESYAKIKEANAFGSNSQVSALMAALAERGVSMPAGFRSKQQQLALYQGLLDRNPEKTVDQIADLVKSGKLQFGAEQKEMQTAAGIAGKVAVAENEIKQFAPLALQASDAVPRGAFVPIAQLLQMGEANISNPQLKTLKIRVNALLNAYDLLAARGGTDKDKRATAHALLTSADGPEAFRAGVIAFQQEAEAAGRAAADAMKGVGGGAQTGGSDQTKRPVSLGTSQSTGKTYIRYSDGTIEPIGP